MSLLGKLISAPIKVAASTTRVARMTADSLCGERDPPAYENIFDNLADAVERDVNDIVGDEGSP